MIFSCQQTLETDPISGYKKSESEAKKYVRSYFISELLNQYPSFLDCKITIGSNGIKLVRSSACVINEDLVEEIKHNLDAIQQNYPDTSPIIERIKLSMFNELPLKCKG